MRGLRMGLPALAAFHIRDILQASVVLLDLPTRLGKLQPSQFIPLRIVGSPTPPYRPRK